MTRAKPDGVPAEAVWSPDDGEWVLAERDDHGRMQGVVTYWRPDGTLVNHCSYADGVPHGWFKRYHENGEVSRAGTFHHGELTGVDACYRSTGETTELAFPVHAMPANVWRYERDIAGGRSLSGRWFDKEGRQVDDTGGPLPERPGNVPAAAVYFAGSRHWALGVVDGKGEQGLWRYWSPEGTPLGEREVRDGRELDRRWFLGADHAAAVTALRDGRAEEALTAARAFWDRADSVEEVVHAGSVLAEVLAGDPAADAERRELLAIVGEAGDYPVVFSPEGFSCYRAQSRALGWLAAIKLDDGDPATAVVLSRQALAREHHFGPCAARVTLFHALARLGLVEDAFALVRETLGADAGFAGFEEVVADPAYREWVASLDVSAMTVEDALAQTGPGALDETAAAVRVEGGSATGTWSLREVLGDRLSPELDRWLDVAGELPETAFDGEFLAAADPGLAEVLAGRGGPRLGRLEGLFLPVSLVHTAEEDVHHAAWVAGERGLSRVYAFNQDDDAHRAAYVSLAGFVQRIVADDEDSELRPVLRERWNRAFYLLDDQEEPKVPAHLDVLALVPRLAWVVLHLTGISRGGGEHASAPGTADWETERAACREWPHLQAYWLLHHLVMGNVEELPELLEYAERRYPPVGELAGIARSVMAGGEPEAAWWDAAGVAGTRAAMAAANPEVFNAAARERLG